MKRLSHNQRQQAPSYICVANILKNVGDQVMGIPGFQPPNLPAEGLADKVSLMQWNAQFAYGSTAR